MHKKVLVIDDEKRIGDILSRLLVREGIAVSTATDGPSGLKLAREIVPDLVILDLAMPGMGGEDVAMALRENARTAHIPFIFLTGAISAEEVAAHAGNVGGWTFLAKGGDVVELTKEIKNALGLQSMDQRR